MFKKSTVEEIISRIIYQDSFGDVHTEAHKVAREYGLSLSSKEREAMEMFGRKDVENVKIMVNAEGEEKARRILEDEEDTKGLEILDFLFQP